MDFAEVLMLRNHSSRTIVQNHINNIRTQINRRFRRRNEE